MNDDYQALEDFVSANAGKSLGARERFEFGELMVYARIAGRLIEGTMQWTLDLADVEIRDEEARGQGHFSRFLERAEQAALEYGLAVYVQSILNRKLLDILVAKGYSLCGGELSVFDAHLSVAAMHSRAEMART
ncbi:hypothetical protein ACNFIA_17535 [Pseudomonas sp. NY15437]|uniref:hypothetical protein n=1 Tax=Pseudomonas sp. NY15437 TaxID=3400360 RepID=UPI003A8C80E2